MTPDLTTLADFARHLADIARGMLMATTAASPEVSVKADRSFVTALDRAIEQRLRGEIAARYPDHGIIGEEEGREREGAAIQWILDPIDGTAPFVAGVPVYGTLVAVALDGIPVIGVMDLPAADNRWIGIAGSPTTHNGRAVRTRAGTPLARAILACMNPDFFTQDDKVRFDRLVAATHWRIYGTSSMGYGLMASGRTDLAMDSRLQIYDCACYRPIIEGAGGIVTDWQGAPVTLETGTRILAAGDKALHDIALATLRG
jgi:inositol-phosphate phosphatase/L-galactose 1-phosphate phosphatase/histidinol-phosphatase